MKRSWSVSCRRWKLEPSLLQIPKLLFRCIAKRGDHVPYKLFNAIGNLECCCAPVLVNPRIPFPPNKVDSYLETKLRQNTLNQQSWPWEWCASPDHVFDVAQRTCNLRPNDERKGTCEKGDLVSHPVHHKSRKVVSIPNCAFSHPLLICLALLTKWWTRSVEYV